MKKVLRHFVVDSLVLYAISIVAAGIIFQKFPQDLFIASAGLVVANMIVKPVINLLLLPINLVTFNLFKWISAAIVLYLVALVLPGFEIVGFTFGGFESAWISLPAIELGQTLAYVMYSFLITLFGALIYWLVK